VETKPTMGTDELTQEQVKELFDYNPDTGELRWRSRHGCRGAGGVAGCDIKANRTGWRVTINHKGYAVHHIAWLWMTGEVVTEYLLHKNGDTRDNTFSNLIKRPFPEHGTAARYGRPYLCRCELCKEAMRAYRARPAEGWDHGTGRKYLSGCRCEVCRAAHNMHYRNYRKRRGFDYVKDSNLRQAFGITLQDYLDLKSKQGRRCAICGEHETMKHHRGVVNQLSVDHDHVTGVVRGLLCQQCNRALGLLKDSIDVLLKAAEYLKRNMAPTGGAPHE
jgi:hypothetical protein